MSWRGRFVKPAVVAVGLVLALGTGGLAQAQPSDPPERAENPLTEALDLLESDPRAAYDLLLRAAPTNPRAGWHAGMLLLQGRVGPPNPRRAYVLIRRAAEAGDENAQISTGVMLATGEGVPEDDLEARDWYQRAADGGSAHALRALGAMLLTGEGGEADPARGIAYLELADEAGDGNARQILRSVGTLNDEQRRQVDARKAERRAEFGELRPAPREPTGPSPALRST